MSICEQYQEHLSDFLDGTLDASRSVAMKAHLEDCGACRREYIALKNTVAMVRESTVPDGGRAQRAALRNLRAAVCTHPSPRRWAFGRLSMIPAGAALATSLAWILVVHNPIRQRSDASNQDPPIFNLSGGHGLPTSMELDEMASQHALHSFAIAAGDGGEDQEKLADARSRLH